MFAKYLKQVFMCILQSPPSLHDCCELIHPLWKEVGTVRLVDSKGKEEVLGEEESENLSV